MFVNSLLSLYRSRHSPSQSAPPTHHTPHPTYPLPPVPAHMLGAPQGWGRAWAGEAGADELAPRRRKLESGAAKEIM